MIAAALVYPLLFLAVALLRLSYPFELEWMEGGVLEQVERVLRGQPIYVAPSLAYVPFDYTPLYFYLAALPARLLGPDFPALRLAALIASLGCLALIFALVWRETRDGAAGLFAACLFAGTYRLSGAWFDIARPDSLFLLLVLAGIIAYRFGPRGARGGALAGALLALAFFAKQTALTVAAPIALHALLTDRRRFAGLAGTLAVLVGAGTWLLDLLHGGWFRYYVFGVALGHSPELALVPQFWTRDLMAHLPIAVLLAAFFLLVPRAVRIEGSGPASGTVAGARPMGRGFHLAVAAGLLGSSGWLRSFRVCYDNVLMPGHAGLAILAGLGWHSIGAWIGTAPERPRASLQRFVGLALFAQLALLAYDPVAQIPTRADRRAGERLIENLRRSPGDVLVPSHSYLAARAGKAPHFHEVALMDVLKRRGSGAIERGLREELDRALQAKRWAALVLDTRDWLRDEAEPYYQPGWPAFDSDTVFWTRTGMLTRPEAVLVPRR